MKHIYLIILANCLIFSGATHCLRDAFSPEFVGFEVEVSGGPTEQPPQADGETVVTLPLSHGHPVMTLDELDAQTDSFTDADRAVMNSVSQGQDPFAEFGVLSAAAIAGLRSLIE